VKYPTPELDRRIKFLKNNAISVVIDVGANIGQYGSELRSIGYEGKIISFEPTNDAFTKLEALSKKDKKWDVFHYSLGEFDGDSEINISKNSVSSSLLNNLPQLIESAPAAAFVAKEKISVKKLDTIFNDLRTDSDAVYLKIDTQGYENMVLNGALNSLKK
jgi:FkbM family methyltransferase